MFDCDWSSDVCSSDLGDGGVDVTEVTYDSRRAGLGTLFVAVRGLTTDGNQFVDAARRKGASAVASENPPLPGGPWIQVTDARRALAAFSAAVLGDPASKLRLIGVTGTNGKTTTSYLIDAALRAAGHTTGLLGTVQYRIGDRLSEAVRTTPEASDLQQLFKEMVVASCTHAVLEVSSHSLALDRVYGCAFKVGVFTNLTRDHLDFHGDMDRYFEAKRRLFDTLMLPDGRAILNAEDDRTPALAAASRAPVWTYALDRPADFQAEDISLSLEATRFRLRSPQGTFPVETPLLGRFNVQNLLAAFAASMALDLDPADVLKGLTSIAGVPGRLERVHAGQPFTVVVDYAHTDDALKKVLETVLQLKPNRLITVFGCGGDRDRSKRPLMGEAAAQMSDEVIVTSDNPRSEDPERITLDVEVGVRRVRSDHYEIIVDRQKAIERAFQMAQPGDIVLIAGKGHENYQILRDRTIAFDDRLIAQKLLESMAAR